MFTLKQQRIFDYCAHRIVLKICKLFQLPEDKPDYFKVISNITYSLNEETCKVTFIIRDLPDYTFCMKCISARDDDESVMIHFYVKHKHDMRKFTYTNSHLKARVYQTFQNDTESEKENNIQVKSILDIVNFIMREPALAYCRAMYGGNSNGIEYKSRIHASFVVLRDKMRAHNNKILNIIVDNLLYLHLKHIINKKLKPEYIRRVNCSYSANNEWQFEIYYKELPTSRAAFLCSGEYNTCFIVYHASKYEAKYERIINFLGGFYHCKFNPSIIVKSIGDSANEEYVSHI